MYGQRDALVEIVVVGLGGPVRLFRLDSKPMPAVVAVVERFVRHGCRLQATNHRRRRVRSPAGQLPPGQTRFTRGKLRARRSRHQSRRARPYASFFVLKLADCLY